MHRGTTGTHSVDPFGPPEERAGIGRYGGIGGGSGVGGAVWSAPLDDRFYSDSPCMRLVARICITEILEWDTPRPNCVRDENKPLLAVELILVNLIRLRSSGAVSDAWSPRTSRLIDQSKGAIDDDVVKAAGSDIYA
jgi:hypothetical protein